MGKLLKDDSTIVAINDTLDSVNGLIGDAGKLRTEVYYRGGYYFGSDPTSELLAENPVAGRARNGVGLRLYTAEDNSYIFELAGHPQGTSPRRPTSFPTSAPATRRWW